MFDKKEVTRKYLWNTRVAPTIVVGAFLLSIWSSNAVAGSDGIVCPLVQVDLCGKTGLFRDSCISIDQLRQKQINAERVVVLDVRSRNSYNHSHIEGSLLSVPYDCYQSDRDASLAEHMKKFSKDTPIVTYCDVGCQTSSATVLQLRRLGFTNVKVLEEGFQVWQEKGYPVSQGTQ